MAMQLGATRDAFLAAGVPTDKANAAAEDLAGFDKSFGQIDVRMERFEGKLQLTRWMVVGLYPLITAVLLKLFIHE